MQNTFITHPDGYCYYQEVTVDMAFIHLADYLIEKKVIQDEGTKSDIEKIKKKCSFYDKIKKWCFTYIDYEVYQAKSIHDLTFEKTLKEVSKNFFLLQEVHSLTEKI